MTAKEERKGHRPPGRPYGGYICPNCLKKGIKQAIRLIQS